MFQIPRYIHQKVIKKKNGKSYKLKSYFAANNSVLEWMPILAY